MRGASFIVSDELLERETSAPVGSIRARAWRRRCLKRRLFATPLVPACSSKQPSVLAGQKGRVITCARYESARKRPSA